MPRIIGRKILKYPVEDSIFRPITLLCSKLFWWTSVEGNESKWKRWELELSFSCDNQKHISTYSSPKQFNRLQITWSETFSYSTVINFRAHSISPIKNYSTLLIRTRILLRISMKSYYSTVSIISKTTNGLMLARPQNFISQEILLSYYGEFLICFIVSCHLK